MCFSHSGLLLFLPGLQVSSCLRTFSLASLLLRMLWPALSHLSPLQPDVTSPKRLPYLCKGASPPQPVTSVCLLVFISNQNYLTYLFTCVYCLFLNSRIRNLGEKGLCLGHCRHLICIVIYKESVESILINKGSVESPRKSEK